MNDAILNAENNVIGSILISPEVVRLINLSPSDFRSAQNEAVYSAIESLYRDGKTIDVVTVQRYLTEKGEPIEASTLIEYMDITTTANNIEAYAETVRDASTNRQLRQIGVDLQEGASETTDCRALLASTIQSLEELQSQDDTSDTVNSVTASCEFAALRRGIEAGKVNNIVKTGYDNLDEMMGGGFRNGGFYIIGARPGMGKTSVAINIADKIARDKKVLFLSLEMSKDEITAKRLSKITGIPANVLMTEKLDKEQTSKVNNGLAELSRLHLEINRKPRIKIAGIHAMAAKTRPKIIFIDYLSLIETPKSEKRNEAVAEMSRELKMLAMRMQIPVVCLVQINRDNEQKASKRPELHNIRESGAIEQDADGVIMLYRAGYYKPEIENKQWESEEMEMIIAKMRLAKTGICRFAWFSNTGLIVPTR